MGADGRIIIVIIIGRVSGDPERTWPTLIRNLLRVDGNGNNNRKKNDW